MTEDEWRSSVRPGPMFDWLEANLSVTQRKKRLFVCAAARLGHEPIRPEVVRLLDAAENVIDQPASQHPDSGSRSEYHDALLSLWRVSLTPHESKRVHLASYVLHGVGKTSACLGELSDLGSVVSPAALADLVRELFGNPFRKTRWIGARLRGRIDTWPRARKPGDRLLVRDWMRWQDGLIVNMLRDTYQKRDWTRLPILADALEDAGCDEADLLGHLRNTGPHTRGCWAVDLLLDLD